jgi:hypothetical protein
VCCASGCCTSEIAGLTSRTQNPHILEKFATTRSDFAPRVRNRSIQQRISRCDSGEEFNLRIFDQQQNMADVKEIPLNSVQVEALVWISIPFQEY